MIPYDTNFDPPAIVLPVTVTGVVHRRPRFEAPALIDTGAQEGCQVPGVKCQVLRGEGEA